MTHIRDSALYNEDLAPVPAASRSWGLWNIAALWVGMAVCIPTYAWFASLLISGVVYVVLSATCPPGAEREKQKGVESND